MSFAAALLGLATAALPTPPALPDAGAPMGLPGEVRIERHVDEDDHVRVEEIRVRGESQRIVVQFKGGTGKAYDITPSSGAVDPSQRMRRAPGTSLWRVFSF